MKKDLDFICEPKELIIGPNNTPMIRIIKHACLDYVGLISLDVRNKTMRVYCFDEYCINKYKRGYNNN